MMNVNILSFQEHVLSPLFFMYLPDYYFLSILVLFLSSSYSQLLLAEEGPISIARIAIAVKTAKGIQGLQDPLLIL